MAQKLTDVTIEAFRMQVPFVSFGNLKKLLEDIYEIKRSSNGYLYVNDLERKETIIEAELMRRGKLQHKSNPEDFKDYTNMKFKTFFKKRFF
jgi:hypothetical protein